MKFLLRDVVKLRRVETKFQSCPRFGQIKTIGISGESSHKQGCFRIRTVDWGWVANNRQTCHPPCNTTTWVAPRISSSRGIWPQIKRSQPEPRMKSRRTRGRYVLELRPTITCTRGVWKLCAHSICWTLTKAGLLALTTICVGSWE